MSSVVCCRNRQAGALAGGIFTSKEATRLHANSDRRTMAFTCSVRGRDGIVTPASQSFRGHLFDRPVRYW